MIYNNKGVNIILEKYYILDCKQNLVNNYNVYM